MDEKWMKTLEEVIQAALNDANEAINPDGTGLSESDIVQFVSRAVREWMREVIDPRLTETEKAQAARIAELEKQLEDERWMHAACLTIVEGAAGIKSIEEITMPVSEAMRQCFRVRAELDAANARIEAKERKFETDEQILHNAGIGNSGAVTDAILSVIPPPRDEMFQAAIAVYESRIKDLEEENKRLKQKLDEEVRLTEGISDKAMEYDKIVESMRTGKVFMPGISPAEAGDLNAILKIDLANKRGFTPEQQERFLKAMKEARAKDRAFQAGQEAYRKGEIVSPSDLATVQKQLEQERERTRWLMENRDEIFSNANKRITELERELDLAHAKLAEANALVAPGVTHTDTAKEVWESVLGKAKRYDALREKFPFLPGEYFYALFNGRIYRFECENILVGGAYLSGKDRKGTTINFRPDECFTTPQELMNKLEIVE